MIDILALRGKVEGILKEDLGSYDFGGRKTPALRVDDGSQIYVDEPKIEGLEVVIVNNPEVGIEPILRGYKQVYTAMIVLKQWDIGKTTLGAMEKLIIKINNIAGIRRLMRDSRLDNIEECRISISETTIKRM